MQIGQRGFTLIEIMIVIGIMAAVITVGAPRLFKTQDNIKAVSRSFISLAKNVRNQARIHNSTYRIVIRLHPTESAYWVERASGTQLIDPAMFTAEGRQKAEEDKKNKEGTPPPAFQIETKITKKEKTLPGKLRFVSLETMNMPQPVTEGEAYIYFFPQGFVEAAALQIDNGNNGVWTLLFNPLTGRVDIIQKQQSLKDTKQ